MVGNDKNDPGKVKVLCGWVFGGEISAAGVKHGFEGGKLEQEQPTRKAC